MGGSFSHSGTGHFFVFVCHDVGTGKLLIWPRRQSEGLQSVSDVLYCLFPTARCVAVIVLFTQMVSV